MAEYSSWLTGSDPILLRLANIILTFILYGARPGRSYAFITSVFLSIICLLVLPGPLQLIGVGIAFAYNEYSGRISCKGQSDRTLAIGCIFLSALTTSLLFPLLVQLSVVGVGFICMTQSAKWAHKLAEPAVPEILKSKGHGVHRPEEVSSD